VIEAAKLLKKVQIKLLFDPTRQLTLVLIKILFRQNLEEKTKKSLSCK
jgi:hypothetical protein